MMQWGTGAKVWMWIVLVVNGLSCLGIIPIFAVLPVLAIITLVLEIILIVGVIILLFKRQKIGFYLLCVCAVLTMIFNIILGTGIIRAVASVILMPTITFLVIRDQWNDLA
ncbi:MAG: hypothetical protein K2K54_07925 [Lachnospiraceae bacterium]|nr:hypothetical protein [Lachnospiraceae bacterium]